MNNTLTICATTTAEIDGTFQVREWNEYKAQQCDQFAIEANLQGNGEKRALWELYAKQYRARGEDF